MYGYAITRHGEPLEKITKPTPVPEGREVLVAVTHAGVCHSDLHLQEGGYDLGSRGSLDFASRGMKLPFFPGHEVVGKVVSWGPDAEDAGLTKGDLRLVFPWIGCGTCESCRADEQNMCLNMISMGAHIDGGFATHVLVPDFRYLIDIEGIDPALAATYACSGVTVYGGIKKFMPIRPKEMVVVVGAGGLGLNAVSMLQAVGHDQICVVDTSEDKLQLAKAQGALHTVLAGKDGAATTAAISEACAGRVFYILDTVNAGATASFAFDALSKGGKLVQIGLFGGELCVPLPLMPAKALTLQGSYVGGLADIREVIALAKKGLLPPIPLTCRPLEDASDALDDLRGGRVSGRVILVNDDAES